MSETQPYAAGPDTGFAMRPSKVLRTIREGKVARVLKINTTDPIVVEIFAQSGPDAVWLCMEHVPTTYIGAANMVRAAKAHDVDAVIRVPRGSYSDYIRALEIDAAGLIVPHVLSAEDAMRVRDITKFSPLGRRAVDGGNADGLYARLPLQSYLETANRERFVCHQIEDPEAVDQLEAIAEIDGVDCLFFGPGDYSVALGIPGQIMHPDVDKVRRKVAEVARRHGKIAATVCGQDTIGSFADMGYNFLSVGADVVALGQYADKAMAAFGDR